jgi:hypothetical protein
MQSERMSNNWAAENLQTIRTLMERSAVYRRALAPVMTFTGLVGMLAAIVGELMSISTVPAFTLYWMGVSLVAIAGDYLLVRRQAIKDKEPFWSPPTRRVTQAVLPAFFAGLFAGAVFVFWVDLGAFYLSTIILPVIWMLLYGCALHAAGFFMPRGIRWFAWVFIAGAAIFLLAILISRRVPPLTLGHSAMGLFFGFLQMAYGFYLYRTEKKNEA